jgi:hypothetical protein
VVRQASESSLFRARLRSRCRQNSLQYALPIPLGFAIVICENQQIARSIVQTAIQSSDETVHGDRNNAEYGDCLSHQRDDISSFRVLASADYKNFIRRSALKRNAFQAALQSNGRLKDGMMTVTFIFDMLRTIAETLDGAGNFTAARAMQPPAYSTFYSSRTKPTSQCWAPKNTS